MRDRPSGERTRRDRFFVQWGEPIFEDFAIGIAVSAFDGRFLVANAAYQRMTGYTEAELQEMTPLDLTEEADRPATRDHIRQLGMGAVRQYQIEKRYRRKDGSVIWVRITASLLQAGPWSRGYVLVIAEDSTERKRIEENLLRSAAYLAESERLGQIGSWGLTLPAREIVFWSQETYRIFGFDPGSGPPALEAVLARIHPEDHAVLETLNGVLAEKKDFELDCRILLPDGSVRYIQTLGNPVVNDAGELVKFNGITVDVTERKLSENALQRAIEQYRALAARLETIREEERRRLAREIHDELGQALTGIKMELRLLIHNPQGAKNSRAILKLIDNTMQSIRRIASELRPRILDDLGLVAAVEWAAEEFAARTEMKYAMDLPHEDIAVDPETATAIFRIFQEALTNIARHAEATEFKVLLTHDDGGLRLEVRDNGKGFIEAQKVPGESLGILGMRERSLLLGGHLTIRSSPGEGATVTVRIPELAKSAAK